VKSNFRLKEKHQVDKFVTKVTLMEERFSTKPLAIYCVVKLEEEEMALDILEKLKDVDGILVTRISGTPFVYANQ
jgi:hypothetical protein